MSCICCSPPPHPKHSCRETPQWFTWYLVPIVIKYLQAVSSHYVTQTRPHWAEHLPRNLQFFCWGFLMVRISQAAGGNFIHQRMTQKGHSLPNNSLFKREFSPIIQGLLGKRLWFLFRSCEPWGAKGKEVNNGQRRLMFGYSIAQSIFQVTSILQHVTSHQLKKRLTGQMNLENQQFRTFLLQDLSEPLIH